MGIIPGARVTLVKYAPMGDPMELRIHGFDLTLRLADAEQIEVKPATDDEVVTTVPPTTQKPTAATRPAVKPKAAEKTNEALPLLYTGTWYIALLILLILLVCSTVLFIMRKRDIYND
jgi:hypothetical protein